MSGVAAHKPCWHSTQALDGNINTEPWSQVLVTFYTWATSREFYRQTSLIIRHGDDLYVSWPWVQSHWIKVLFIMPVRKVRRWRQPKQHGPVQRLWSSPKLTFFSHHQNIRYNTYTWPRGTREHLSLEREREREEILWLERRANHQPAPSMTQMFTIRCDLRRDRLYSPNRTLWNCSI